LNLRRADASFLLTDPHSPFHAARSPCPPRCPTATFLAGILTNLLLAMMPAPEIAQALGSALRNLGLALMGLRLVRPEVTGAA
jgi:hypothetical protein